MSHKLKGKSFGLPYCAYLTEAVPGKAVATECQILAEGVCKMVSQSFTINRKPIGKEESAYG